MSEETEDETKQITGAFIRIERDGKWVNLDIVCLTDEELADLEKSQPDRGWMWAKFLSGWIRDNVIQSPVNNEGEDGP